MECVMQWLDELDDLVHAVVASSEWLRRFFRSLCASLAVMVTLVGGAAAALLQPVFAPALAGLLLLTLLYRRLQPYGRGDMASIGG